MTNYIYPTPAREISDSFNDHVARGSVNPGVDYVCSTGTPIYAVADGTVTVADNSNGGSGGRTIHINHDDGSGSDYLHLDSVQTAPGDWVRQGITIGYSGASGNGNDNEYGPHLHISFRYNHHEGFGNDGNQDIQAILDAQSTVPVEGSKLREKKVKVNFYKTVDGTVWYGAYAINSDAKYQVLQRYDKSNSDELDEFNAEQKDWILAALKANGVHS